MTQRAFPSDFLWGSATSSYQIEGAAFADGRSESIWDRFCKQPGAIIDQSNGDIACDHYNRYRDDVALMARLGLQAYRFSVAWPRVLPNGRGAVNQAGLDFYRRLVDELLQHNIRPFVTLYHWDLPQILEDQGGWPVRATAEAFVEYADAVSRALGDTVKDWITHNEPWCAGLLGYQNGEHAPGRKNWNDGLKASHHLLLSHGWAVDVIRRNVPQASVGITLNFTPAMPASRSTEDLNATRHFDGFFNRWFLDPVYGREYPADMVRDYTELGYLPNGLDFVQDGDYKAMAATTDFLGVNYYSRAVLHDPKTGTAPKLDSEYTDIGWEVYPQGLGDLLKRLAFAYNPGKIYVTENGASYNDGPDANGEVNDTRRTQYLHDHLSVCSDAIAAGVPLAGYFVWSLMDNFEWAKGYSQRFGVVWVNYETQERIPKASAHWYSRVVKANAVQPLEVLA
ncbi:MULTISPECIES: GH1 family beta-glucosidase [Herpetosiphon]|uniref:Beta-glucosidase n=1 Tax=Herpetosiphon geysericola TaxID=70996 RepID=A0A0N8GTC3_9CHLR|nr:MULTISPECIES: GH1 family beta-glucosidase [Herpetosiphon]KPL91698.1 beta-glucosidase [Herpetosiphon geysericola]